MFPKMLPLSKLKGEPVLNVVLEYPALERLLLREPPRLTSSENDLPRNIEFLYSKNRLNVAISRARCQAIVIANPALTAIKCQTPEQMALVNLLCWVAEAGRH